MVLFCAVSNYTFEFLKIIKKFIEVIGETTKDLIYEAINSINLELST